MNNIKDFLHKNRLKQTDLADFLGVSKSAVSKMVNNLSDPSPENLKKILTNDRGWDATELTITEGKAMNFSAVGIGNRVIQTPNNERLLFLEGQVKDLKEQLRQLQETNTKLLDIISKLSK